MTNHLTMTELRAGLPHIQASPADSGTLRLIVARPAVDARVVQGVGELSPADGLVGDDWRARDGERPDRQLTLINARALALIAGDEARWPLAGDQLVVDLDLSAANLPVGQRLRMGTAVLEVTAAEHRGCLKFAARFGNDALKFVNQDGWPLRLRGIYARVVQPGQVQVGDAIRKLAAD